MWCGNPTRWFIKRMKYITIFIILNFFIFRLWYINKIELSPDECYYWEWSRNLDYCYMDQGPVLGVVIFFFTKLFGVSNEFTVRFGAVISGLLTSIVGYIFTKKIFKSTSAGVFTLLLFNLIPFTSIGQMLMTHDNIQILFWSLSCYFFYKVINNEIENR